MFAYACMYGCMYVCMLIARDGEIGRWVRRGRWMYSEGRMMPGIHEGMRERDVGMYSCINLRCGDV